MNRDAMLQFSFRPEARLPDVHRTESWRGFSVEFSRINGASEYSFSLTCDRHYLCLHDLLLSDGSMVVDGMRPIQRKDLRNNMTYLPRHTSISGFAAPVDRTNSFTAFYFDPEEIATETERLYRATDSFAMVYFDDARLRTTLEKMRTVMASDQEPDRLYAETLALLTAIEVAQMQTGALKLTPGQSGGLSGAQLKLVFDFVDSRLGAEVSLDDMAAVARLSRFHFARAFKKSVGEPPYAYVLRQRIERAKVLLKTTKMQVNEVAVSTGFKTASHFVRAFQQAVGTSPGSFRRA
ncbi:AraC family transcriptional regulator [Aquibium microcysteis]|uniref:AraC family transcriptional regulator n=1 Tax=Aquibium microcysteis TaxID=675281 RepID=UPI00165CFA83|nr:AraC family transcriptional regulator [Aquibium microcysteis]